MYVKLLLAGRKRLPKEGDASQLGGDFITDAHGVLQLVHRSFDPADRPSVDNLLKVIREIPVPRDLISLIIFDLSVLARRWIENFFSPDH